MRRQLNAKPPLGDSPATNIPAAAIAVIHSAHFRADSAVRVHILKTADSGQKQANILSHGNLFNGDGSAFLFKVETC